MRVTPLSEVELLSTHDQLLGGAHGQTYEGCVFPAASAYAPLIAAEASKADERLVSEGVLGRYAIDFVCAETEVGWASYAIELNLQKGGTTHTREGAHALYDRVIAVLDEEADANLVSPPLPPLHD